MQEAVPCKYYVLCKFWTGQKVRTNSIEQPKKCSILVIKHFSLRWQGHSRSREKAWQYALFFLNTFVVSVLAHSCARMRKKLLSILGVKCGRKCLKTEIGGRKLWTVDGSESVVRAWRHVEVLTFVCTDLIWGPNWPFKF